nr:immunoglobulin light chain junction region [Macaca mulatta]MPN80353.1 immunoglobulin light chain junction region [Macaca mulatta]MPN80537.1 immunoglobulin light chain junction region [Macaca mulatta]MPN81499.1 immunoglobulin light chain junction region [Macaca mulatta]
CEAGDNSLSGPVF